MSEAKSKFVRLSSVLDTLESPEDVRSAYQLYLQAVRARKIQAVMLDEKKESCTYKYQDELIRPDEAFDEWASRARLVARANKLHRDAKVTFTPQEAETYFEELVQKRKRSRPNEPGRKKSKKGAGGDSPKGPSAPERPDAAHEKE